LTIEEDASLLLKELFLDYHKLLLKWSKSTGQTSQLDSGYIAQHLISLLTGIHGSGMRGKGKDLSDGSEIKTASSVAGVDVPRWNHMIGGPASSVAERKKKIAEFLIHPQIYYVLFDTRKADKLVRVRIWKVTPAKDSAFRKVIENWDRLYPPPSYNFQLHPPVQKDVDVATNEAGNLKLPLMFESNENANGIMKVMKFDLSERPCEYLQR
jgi:MamI restriction endonuclease